MQLDYIIADEKAIVLRVWNDNMLPIGLDKKPSLCTLLVDMEKCKKRTNIFARGPSNIGNHSSMKMA